MTSIQAQGWGILTMEKVEKGYERDKSQDVIAMLEAARERVQDTEARRVKGKRGQSVCDNDDNLAVRSGSEDVRGDGSVSGNEVNLSIEIAESAAGDCCAFLAIGGSGGTRSLPMSRHEKVRGTGGGTDFDDAVTATKAPVKENREVVSGLESGPQSTLSAAKETGDGEVLGAVADFLRRRRAKDERGWPPPHSHPAPGAHGSATREPDRPSSGGDAAAAASSSDVPHLQATDSDSTSCAEETNASLHLLITQMWGRDNTPPPVYSARNLDGSGDDSGDEDADKDNCETGVMMVPASCPVDVDEDVFIIDTRKHLQAVLDIAAAALRVSASQCLHWILLVLAMSFRRLGFCLLCRRS